MTKTLLNREIAAKKAAEYYINNPTNLLEGLDYKIIANRILNADSNAFESLGQFKLYQNIMIYSGLVWELYTSDDFEEQLQLKMREWIATP